MGYLAVYVEDRVIIRRALHGACALSDRVVVVSDVGKGKSKPAFTASLDLQGLFCPVLGFEDHLMRLARSLLPVFGNGYRESKGVSGSSSLSVSPGSRHHSKEHEACQQRGNDLKNPSFQFFTHVLYHSNLP